MNMLGTMSPPFAAGTRHVRCGSSKRKGKRNPFLSGSSQKGRIERTRK